MLAHNTVRHRDLKYGAGHASVIVSTTSSALGGHAIERSQWACEQSGLRPDFSSSVQRYAVHCPFNHRPDEDRHQPLGAALLVASQTELCNASAPNTTGLTPLQSGSAGDASQTALRWLNNHG
jgi:hypothetical protein